MKKILVSSLRAAALAATLFVLPAVFAHAPDRAAQILAATGSVRLESAGPYVNLGTYSIQVSTKLGAPSATLSDGSLLYNDFSIEDSAAHGTLIVRFIDGRVSSLSLASPAAVIALRAGTEKSGDKVLVATRK